MPMVNLGDAELYYQLDDFTDPWAPSQAIFMHHGFGRHGGFWYGWVPLLARHYRVVRVDARGHGRSTKPEPGFAWSLDLLVEDSRRLLDTLGLERVHWVGESGGGLIGLLFALRYPHRLSSLTLCASLFRAGREAQRGMAVGGVDWASAYAKLGVKEWVLATMHTRLDPSQADPRFLQWYAEESARTPPEVYGGIVRCVAGTDLYDQLPHVQAPALVLAPEHSTVSPLPEQRILARRIPGAKLTVFRGYRHAISSTIPERCARATLRFLKGLQ